MQTHDCDEKRYNKKKVTFKKPFDQPVCMKIGYKEEVKKKKKQLPAKSSQNNELSIGAPEQMVGLSLLKRFCTNYGRLDMYLRLDISLSNPLNWIVIKYL